MLGLALLLAACSSGGDDDEAGTTTTTTAAGDQAGIAWTREDLQPVTAPIVVDGTAIVLVADDGAMQVVALDPATGETRWSAEASPGAAPPGIAVSIMAVGDDGIAFFRPAGDDLIAELVVADAATGDVRWSSDALEFGSHPKPCEDGEGICAEADLGRGGQLVRFLGEGAVRPESFPTGARSLGNGLLDLGERDPELLAGYQEGAVRWRTPLADVFGEGFSSDRGWNFATYDDVIVGAVGQDVPLDLPVVVDFGAYVTAALGREDGRPRWRDVGSSFTCFGKLELQMDGGGTHEDAADYLPWPVRCRVVGTTTYESLDSEGEPDITSMTIEGFDPATGDTTWSLEADPAILSETSRPCRRWRVRPSSSWRAWWGRWSSTCGTVRARRSATTSSGAGRRPSSRSTRPGSPRTPRSGTGGAVSSLGRAVRTAARRVARRRACRRRSPCRRGTWRWRASPTGWWATGR